MSAGLPDRVSILEVGPRDGLQNETSPLPTEVKIAFIRALAAAGLSRIEATSFVSPRAIPQLGDAAEVAAALPTDGAVEYSALVPNLKGLERAIAAGVRRIALFTAASDAFTRANINMTVDESFATYAHVARAAVDAGLTVRGYVSTAFVCPYVGPIEPERVRDVSRRLLEIGCDEIAVSDTIGAAVPTDIERTVGVVLEAVPLEHIALHLHDTYGTALANVCAGLRLGVTRYDASAGGLGGCPYAPGAAGNLATEDLVYLLDGLGVETGVDLESVYRASRLIADALGRTLPGKQFQRLSAASSE